jgi:hypothetical protein
MARPAPTRPTALRPLVRSGDGAWDVGWTTRLLPVSRRVPQQAEPWTPSFLCPCYSGLRPARHYPRFRIWCPSPERQRDPEPPDLSATQRTLWTPPTARLSSPKSSHPAPPGLHPFGSNQRSRCVCITDQSETSPVPSPTLCDAKHRPHPALPTPEGSSRLQFQVLHRFRGLAIAQQLVSLSVPSSRADISTLSCESCFAIRFVLGAAVLLPFRRGEHRFSTSGHPDALAACYVAS